MELDYNLLNIIILFGAIQGFALCFYIYQKRSINKASVNMFLWFLFCLSFLNMMYGFLDLDLFKYWRPLHMFPFPYKWILGPAFYFYVKNQFVEKGERPFHKKEWLLFLPAILYGIVRCYWFSIAISDEDGYRITGVLVHSKYFVIQEIVLFFFNIILGLLALKFINTKKDEIVNTVKTTNAIHWLKRFVWVFVGLHIFGLIVFLIDLLLHNGRESFLFLYPVLIVNVAYIYWIGFIGFTKPKNLFNSFKLHTKETLISSEILNNQVTLKIEKSITDEIYTNPNLTLAEMASNLDISAKELSKYINEKYHKNFSEFLNFHRVEKVKKLLASEDSKKYTLVTLASAAGFSSKSSFNATFKKMVGMTPSAYRKELNK